MWRIPCCHPLHTSNLSFLRVTMSKVTMHTGWSEGDWQEQEAGENGRVPGLHVQLCPNGHVTCSQAFCFSVTISLTSGLAQSGHLKWGLLNLCSQAPVPPRVCFRWSRSTMRYVSNAHFPFSLFNVLCVSVYMCMYIGIYVNIHVFIYCVCVYIHTCIYYHM